ncbi:MAG: hypothetical protein ACLSDQ_08430 [Adlercreutzia equolifaciens]
MARTGPTRESESSCFWLTGTLAISPAIAYRQGTARTHIENIYRV